MTQAAVVEGAKWYNSFLHPPQQAQEDPKHKHHKQLRGGRLKKCILHGLEPNRVLNALDEAILITVLTLSSSKGNCEKYKFRLC